jgi:hypothetical protein
VPPPQRWPGGEAYALFISPALDKDCGQLRNYRTTRPHDMAQGVTAPPRVSAQRIVPVIAIEAGAAPVAKGEPWTAPRPLQCATEVTPIKAPPPPSRVKST